MANPALNERTFAPERLRTIDPGRLEGGVVDEGWRDRMTLDGVVVRSLTLFPILLVTGYLAWQSVDRGDGTVAFPGWLLIAVLGGLGVAILTIFKPKLSPITAPIYAAIEGLVLGAISAVYENAYDGIVLQAVMLTAGVFLLMLTLFSKRIVTVDDKFRRGVMMATGAVFLVYMITLVLNLFGASVPYIHDSGPVGILFSLVVVGIASANLLLDFDLIEKGIQAGAPKWMEWYAAFGLLVTLVWLYLELLRLLSKLRDR
jgi:uncharacterized YccA/Bax inhibitor family protein